MALINGSDLNDNITGDRSGVAERDIINGLTGDDTLSGLGGNDSLNGGDGIDILIGGEGDDFLAGNRGDDRMFAGDGNDRMFWIDGDGSDVMLGGAGSDTVEFVGSAKAGDTLTLEQGAGNDSVRLSRTNLVPITLNIFEVETINIAGVEGRDTLFIGRLGETSLSKINFSGGAGDDLLSVSNNPMPQIDARGDSGNDNLFGGNQNDILNGGSGNDALFGGGGNDSSGLGRVGWGLSGLGPTGN
ncbi:calcium-binding protein [Leptolyngbya sp. 7M]|uniref:calcium-binding protein n=1 Tax=Leptolyngbya sp. 7M TaxID=2812896 RepID=UPI001B8D30B1|nr:calcium-binding protein [Leptolyngbya sp. 7M]QYO63159.1 hypothetical protein JVX88_24845 [Leptolyngbya sp. 7M]